MLLWLVQIANLLAAMMRVLLFKGLTVKKSITLEKVMGALKKESVTNPPSINVNKTITTHDGGFKQFKGFLHTNCLKLIYKLSEGV